MAGDNRKDTEDEEADELYLEDEMEKLDLNNVSNVAEHFDGSYRRIDV